MAVHCKGGKEGCGNGNVRSGVGDPRPSTTDTTPPHHNLSTQSPLTHHIYVHVHSTQRKLASCACLELLSAHPVRPTSPPSSFPSSSFSSSSSPAPPPSPSSPPSPLPAAALASAARVASLAAAAAAAAARAEAAAAAAAAQACPPHSFPPALPSSSPKTYWPFCRHNDEEKRRPNYR